MSKDHRKEVRILYEILYEIYDEPKLQNTILHKANLSSRNLKYFIKKMRLAGLITIETDGFHKEFRITEKGKFFCSTIKEYALIE